MEDRDIPCVCGHAKKEHQFNFKGSNQLVCKVRESDDLISDWQDKCMKYVADNLLYIERLAKEKKLI